jgi:DNA polymerase
MIAAKKHELYSSIVSCPLKCSGITNDSQHGIIPRSFYAKDDADITMLIIGKNPGTAPQWETDRYVNKPPIEIAKEHLVVVEGLFDEALRVSSQFHNNLIKRVSFILDVPATPQDVFAHAALSALVKCQSDIDKHAQLPLSTMNTCFHQHLMTELNLYKPKYLLALGSEVFKYLTKPEIKALHKLPVGELYHPSWSNMKGGEENYRKTVLPVLRDQYKAAIK